MGKRKSAPQQTTGQTVSSAPWGEQANYLREIFHNAQNNYKAHVNDQPFPGTQYAGFMPEELEAMNWGANRARAGSPSTAAARDYYMGILSGSPEAMQSTLGPRVGELLPDLQSQFNRHGMGNSSLGRAAEQELVMRELSKLKENAASQLRGMGPEEYKDIAALEAIGGTRRDMEQEKINDQIYRHQYAQEQPWNTLAKYLGNIMGNYGGTEVSSGYSGGAPGQSRLSGLLGGGLGGAGIGSMFGPWGAGIGGLLGGLGGLF